MLASLKPFFISLLPFTIWSLFLWHLQIISIYVFLLSVVFSAYIFFRFGKSLKNLPQYKYERKDPYKIFNDILWVLPVIYPNEVK